MSYVVVTAVLGCVLALVMSVQWVVDRVRGVQPGTAGAGTPETASETTPETASAALAADTARLPRVDLRPAERASGAAGSGDGELLAAAGGGA